MVYIYSVYTGYIVLDNVLTWMFPKMAVFFMRNIIVSREVAREKHSNDIFS